MFYSCQSAEMLQKFVEIVGVSCTYMYLSEASTHLDLYIYQIY